MMMMTTYWRVTELRVIEDFALWVRFADGLEGEVRFPPEFFYGVFAHLNDPGQFRQVAVVDGAVTWPGGLDLAPDAMYDDIKRHIEQRLGFMDGEFSVPDDFDRMGDVEIRRSFEEASISTKDYKFDCDAANERAKNG